MVNIIFCETKSPETNTTAYAVNEINIQEVRIPRSVMQDKTVGDVRRISLFWRKEIMSNLHRENVALIPAAKIYKFYKIILSQLYIQAKITQ